ncbi:MAG: S9 family peptidase [Chloroflexota bacterium]
MLEPTVAPFGSWESPIRLDDVVAEVTPIAEPWLDGDDTYWLEDRPAEAGRSVLVRAGPDGATVDLTPSPFDVRSRVHEYGGRAYTAAGGIVVFSDVASGRLHRLDPGVDEPVPLTPEGAWRYADLRFDPSHRRFLAVREDHTDPGAVRNEIVSISLDGDRSPDVLVTGPDFVAAPRPSPDGRRLVWLEWDHPDMPWDATRLRVAPVRDDGWLDPAELAAGGPDESVAQPEWSPDGTLHLVSDRSGWWNLYRLVDGPRLEPVGPMAADFADPAWAFGLSSYGFLPDGSIVAVGRHSGRDRLYHLAPGVLVGEVETPFSEFDWLVVAGDRIVVVAGAPAEPTCLVRLDPQTLAPTGVLRRTSALSLDPGSIAVPEPIEFPTTDGETARALFYRPTNAAFQAPRDERAPLVVQVHGGPTGNVSTRLDLEIQFLTSRGIAVCDVDYRGSTGYGRAYRRLLAGAWGVADVDDCVAAARHLADRGEVDPDRMAISGRSSGGLTTLAALAFRNVFAAGISAYGIGDLEALTRDFHKFEARYLDALVGPYPEAADLYRQRSPIHAIERIDSPVLVLQGLDDRIVPATQAEAIVRELAERGIPYAYVAFAGEGHGFQGADAIRRSVAAQLSFLGAVFGFAPADRLEPIEIAGLEAWRERRQAAPV